MFDDGLLVTSSAWVISLGQVLGVLLLECAPPLGDVYQDTTRTAVTTVAFSWHNVLSESGSMMCCLQGVLALTMDMLINLLQFWA